MSKSISAVDAPSRSVPFVRSAYNYDMDAASVESAISFAPVGSEDYDGKTQQQFTQECDPNYVIERHRLGADVRLGLREPIYGDFTDGPPSYHEALNQVKAIERQFMELPASMRNRFENDPQRLIDFVNNNDNYEEAVNLGLIDRKPAPPVVDLSTASLDALKGGKASEAVDKSGRSRSGFSRRSEEGQGDD